jgi:hypothetical protein
MSFHMFYTNLLWLVAYIYGSLQPFWISFSKATKETYTSIYNYCTDNKMGEESNNNQTTSTLSVYVSDGEKMIPFSFDISKLHKHLLLFYVVVKIDDTRNKVIVFNSLDKLVFLYNNLQDLVKSRISRFSKFLEVRITNNTAVDHLDTFSEYTDRSDTYYSDITGYNIRARDIYDFTDNNFLLSSGGKLRVTKMDLDSDEYSSEQQLGS